MKKSRHSNSKKGKVAKENQADHQHSTPLPSPSPVYYDPQPLRLYSAKKKRHFDPSDWILLTMAIIPATFFLLRLFILHVTLSDFLNLKNLEHFVINMIEEYGVLSLAVIILLVSAATVAMMKMKHTISLIEYVCWQPPQSAEISHEQFIEKAKKSGCFTEESISFQEFLIKHNGLGNQTYLPEHVFDPKPTLEAQTEEAVSTISAVFSQLTQSCTWFDPKTDLDILIVVCSSFTTQPSLCSQLCNKFKLKSSIRCYTLTGMGTAGGLLGIDLASDLLQTRSHLYACVITTENINTSFYRGNTRPYLVANTLWRWGASACLLSNSAKAQRYARYKLLKCIRTNMGENDDCFNSLRVEQDDKGNRGMLISKSLRRPVGHALKANINTLCPYSLRFCIYICAFTFISYLFIFLLLLLLFIIFSLSFSFLFSFNSLSLSLSFLLL